MKAAEEEEKKQAKGKKGGMFGRKKDEVVRPKTEPVYVKNRWQPQQQAVSYSRPPLAIRDDARIVGPHVVVQGHGGDGNK